MNTRLPRFACGVIAVLILLRPLEVVASPCESTAACLNEPTPTDDCFERNLGCGHFAMVVAHFNSGVAIGNHQYFFGHALFSLATESRAHSLVCENALAAKPLLITFLREGRKRFKTTGGFGTDRDLKYIYHATNMVEHLKTIKGCMEEGLLRAEVEDLAESNAASAVKAAFLNPPEALKEPMDAMFAMIRNLTTQVSKLVNLMSMRAVEMSRTSEILQEVKTVADTFSIDKLTAMRNEVENNLSDPAEKKSQEAKTFNLTPEKLQELNGKLIAAGKAAIDTAPLLHALASTIHSRRPTGSVAGTVWELEALLPEAATGMDPGGAVHDIAGMWAKPRPCTSATLHLWYCKWK